jgi:hypothetical protein
MTRSLAPRECYYWEDGRHGFEVTHPHNSHLGRRYMFPEKVCLCGMRVKSERDTPRDRAERKRAAK